MKYNWFTKDKEPKISKLKMEQRRTLDQFREVLEEYQEEDQQMTLVLDRYNDRLENMGCSPVLSAFRMRYMDDIIYLMDLSEGVVFTYSALYGRTTLKSWTNKDLWKEHHTNIYGKRAKMSEEVLDNLLSDPSLLEIVTKSIILGIFDPGEIRFLYKRGG